MTSDEILEEASGIAEEPKLEDLINYLPLIEYGGWDDFDELIKDQTQIKLFASQLYKCTEDSIKIIEAVPFGRRGVGKIYQFRIEFSDGKKSKFYVKRCWEGGLKEAAGMELANLLTETPFRYLLVGSTVLLVEHIEGKLFEDIQDNNSSLWKEYDNDDIKFEIGVAQEYAKFLGLGDRRSDRNVILTNDKRVVNIDFGFLFDKDGKTYESLFGCVKVRDEGPVIKGREKAKNILYQNLKKSFSKIKMIYRGLQETKGVRDPFYVMDNYCRQEGWDVTI